MNSSFGVDSVKQRHPKAPIIILNLLTPEGKRLLWQYLQNDRVIGVWLAELPPKHGKYRTADHLRCVMTLGQMVSRIYLQVTGTEFAKLMRCTV